MTVQVVKKINLSSLLDQGGKQEKHLIEVKQAHHRQMRKQQELLKAMPW
jgi:hypothetical protein